MGYEGLETLECVTGPSDPPNREGVSTIFPRSAANRVNRGGLRGSSMRLRLAARIRKSEVTGRAYRCRTRCVCWVVMDPEDQDVEQAGKAADLAASSKADLLERAKKLDAYGQALIEVVAAAIHLLDNPDATVEELMEFVPGRVFMDPRLPGLSPADRAGI